MFKLANYSFAMLCLFGYFSRFLSPLPPGLQAACLSLRGEEFKVNKNTLIAAFRLACLEIRSRNEETINSTRNMIYSLNVFYFLLYRRRYFLFVSEFI